MLRLRVRVYVPVRRRAALVWLCVWLCGCGRARWCQRCPPLLLLLLLWLRTRRARARAAAARVWRLGPAGVTPQRRALGAVWRTGLSHRARSSSSSSSERMRCA
jgi:hypothetical protein